MTIKREAKTHIHLVDEVDVRRKLMKITEHSSHQIRDLQNRAGTAKGTVKRVLQASNRQYAIVDEPKNMMVVIEL